MSTNNSVGRSAAAQENDRSAVNHKKDRSRLCAFTFADGRQCRTPRRSGHQHLCYFHGQKEAESLAAKQAGKDISSFFFANLLTACDLSAAMARLFSAVAQGQIKPKVASTLAYLSQTMLQSIPIAQHEYCEAFGSDTWRKAVRSSFTPSAPAPQSAPKPAAQPSHAPASKPTPQPAPQPTSQPALPPAAQPTSQPAVPPQPKPQPVTQSTSKPASPAPQPIPKPNLQPTPQPTSKLSTQPTPLPASPPAATPPSQSPQPIASQHNSTTRPHPNPSQNRHAL